jgi:PIN domain nuclease of toxin-antitoxin system
MRLLLDTVTFLFAVEPSCGISQTAKAALADASNVRELRVGSLAEIARKIAIGKLTLRKEDILAAIDDLPLRLLPRTNDHAFCLFGPPRTIATLSTATHRASCSGRHIHRYLQRAIPTV